MPGFEFFTSTDEHLAIESTTGAEDHHLYFGGAGHLDLQPSALENIEDEITISFWAYGDPALLPANTQILDGRDNANRRRPMNG